MKSAVQMIITTIEKVGRLSQFLAGKDVVVLTGAGMSTDSDVPDFRSTNGMWQDADIERLASPEGLNDDFERFTEFYRWRIREHSKCKPNRGHEILANWEHRGLVRGIITQNVDGFHQEAGSSNVVEMHGSLRLMRCQSCQTVSSPEGYLVEGGERCALCGTGKIRPGVVMFGEL